jgi:hypothetical protein
MRKKKLIISLVVVVCVLVGSFFVIKFGVVGRIYNAINKLVMDDEDKEVELLHLVPSEDPEELMYETEMDKDGNEYVVEYRKVNGLVDAEGNEVEMWEDTADTIKIYDNNYLGRIEKIEDNKIYFMVDMKDSKDYEIIFDINTFDFKEDYPSHYWSDFLEFDHEDFYSAGDLEFLVGKYLRVQDAMREDYYTGHRHKGLIFYLQ